MEIWEELIKPGLRVESDAEVRDAGCPVDRSGTVFGKIAEASLGLRMKMAKLVPLIAFQEKIEIFLRFMVEEVERMLAVPQATRGEDRRGTPALSRRRSPGW